jgi:hypothetical protein
MTCVVSSRPKQGTQPVLKFFWCSNDFIIQKVYFLAVNAGLCWLNNVTGVYLVQFSLLLIRQQSLGHSSSVGPGFPLAGGLCKFYAIAGLKLLIQRQPLLEQYKQQANPLLSKHNYTPLVISGKDKNKRLTLSSQGKLALTGRKTLFPL